MFRNITRTLLVAAFLVPAPFVASAQNLPGLQHHADVEAALLVVMKADLIRKKCKDISARKLKAIFFIRGIQKDARALGYSKQEIEDHVEDEDQKARLKAIVLAEMAEQGLDPDDKKNFCKLGKSEISAESRVGDLLVEG